MIYINLFLAALFLLRRKASCISEQKHKYADLKFKALIHADGLEIPVDITLERRRDTRLGLTGKRATLRMPLGAQPDYVQQQLKKLEEWVEEVFVKKPMMRHPFERKEYKTGDILTVGTRRYHLDIQFEDRVTHTAKLIGDTIHLQLSKKASEGHVQKSIKTLLSRVVAGDFQQEIKNRVLDWNDRTFRKHIKSVNLKYNHSNWGSCSSNNNVNLSTRLLFAPTDVQDYVIVHELAHLVELNHSDRFWSLVEKYVPDYPEKERWLKKNRSFCDF
ncbi:MAG: M48 family metallopeptidase [Lewinellaceae bacterium]|nr:M48 family metallopeptidase [Saprospiraceae bacterium]MCB9344756.1 M48 family metallopeptidase [Lewinellaceae bacterium]